VFWYLDEVLIAAGTLAWLAVSLELGFRAGRAHEKADSSIESHLGMLQGSMLGLLALLLGFTFSLSVERFETRKALVVEEANNIGTTWLRTQFLRIEDQQLAQPLIVRYVQSRLRFFEAGIDDRELEQASREASDLQAKLWNIAVRASSEEPGSHAIALFVQTLNDLIDDSEKRVAALNNHVPDAVVALLLCIAGFAAALVGFGGGLCRRRRAVLNTAFCLTLVLVIVLIMDIDRPRRGFVTVDQGSMERLAMSLALHDRQDPNGTDPMDPPAHDTLEEQAGTGLAD
jgi:hypothetical protein